jgi:DNA-binding NarL/FixJ family response regulator
MVLMLNILIADDHSIVRHGLKQILAETPDMAVADEASTGEEALEKALEKQYDVIVLDIAMPGRGGLDVLKQIKSQKPKLPVLVLSMSAGYLTKESAPDELINAIKKVSKGMKYVSDHLAEELAFAVELDTERPIQEKLSDREFHVMCMIASGKTVKEIADELSLSSNTVNTYKVRILEKMRMKSNAELTHYAIMNQLVV